MYRDFSIAKKPRIKSWHDIDPLISVSRKDSALVEEKEASLSNWYALSTLSINGCIWVKNN